jgi:LuxR family maltose regulon positive regulatory protein
MITGLLATKFHIPPWRPPGVSRPRLVNQLAGGLDEARRLTLVSAPAGYGKTTLMAEWIHSLRGEWRLAWLSLDAADNDPGRFLTYFLAAFQHADPSIFESAPSLLNLQQLPPTQVLLDALINRLSLLEAPILLILDDYQVISNPVIHETLAYVIEHQPAGLHLVLLTRQDPPLPLSRLRARRQMTEIRAQHLRFTPDEAGNFFAHVMQVNLAEEAALALGERTEGWAVGLQLAGLALQNNTDPDRFIQSFRGSHRYVLDYLAEEVIAQQGEQVRAFLVYTSVLDRFSASLSSALTGQPNAQAVMDRLEKGNLFIVPLDNERVWYRYHHLFRDYLLTLIDKTEQAELYKKASAWHEANDMRIEAVRYALASGDPDFSVEVVERAVNQNAIWSGGNIALLTSWLGALPDRVLQARPKLTLNASRIFYLASQFHLAEKHLSQAEEALQTLSETPETEQLLALAALYRGSIACVRGDIQQAIEQTTLAQARLSKENHLAHARAYYNLGQAYEADDQLDRAVDNYLLSSSAAQVAGVHFLAIQARCAAAQVQIRQGRLHLAEQTCQEAVQSGGGERIPPLGLAYIVLGAIALERNQLDAAEDLLENGITLSRDGGLMDNAVLGLASLARVRACKGDVVGALAMVQDARAAIQSFGVPLLASYAAAFLARLQLAIGQPQEAARWAEGYMANRGTAAAEYEDLTLARVLLADSQLEAVPSLLHPILEKATQAGRQYTCIETMLLLSLFHHARKETGLAEDWITRSVVLGALSGAVRIFLDTGRPLVELLPKARAAAPEFVDTLLKIAAPAPETAATANAGLPEPLSTQELRVLALIVAGRSNQEIAEELVISVGTAKWHVHNILQKLGVSNRPQAIALAREIGL